MEALSNHYGVPAGISVLFMANSLAGNVLRLTALNSMRHLNVGRYLVAGILISFGPVDSRAASEMSLSEAKLGLPVV